MPIRSYPSRASHATARRASTTAWRQTCTVRATLALTMKSARVRMGGIRRSW